RCFWCSPPVIKVGARATYRSIWTSTPGSGYTGTGIRMRAARDPVAGAGRAHRGAKEGTMIRSLGHWSLAVAAVLALGGAPGPAQADGPPTAVRLTGLRTWASPTGPRVVFDFSAEVQPVAPDSGSARQLVVSVPGIPLQIADGVPTLLAVRDSVVDSVTASA